jgi:hypothetical protein
MPTDDEATDPRSADAKIIAELARARSQSDHRLNEATKRNPRLAAAIELQHEFEFLAAVATGEYSRPYHRRKAARILVRRFGALGARHLIASMLPVGHSEYRLILKPREDAERRDRGGIRREVEQQWQDYQLLEEVLKQREKGLSPGPSIEAAQRILGRPITVEGGKKALARAQNMARKRGFADPFAVFKAAILGGTYEPGIKLGDLPRPGRPKKATKGG